MFLTGFGLKKPDKELIIFGVVTLEQEQISIRGIFWYTLDYLKLSQQVG